MTTSDSHYDVAIAGAGPAGAQCARDAAARGYDVVLLETESEEEFPRQSNKSTAGTFPSMLAAFGVPDRVIQNATDSVVLESPNTHFKREQPGAVMDFAAFKQWLVDEARGNGAELRFDARVSTPVEENGDVVGIEYNGSESVYADIVIDATGPSAPLAKQLGVSNLERGNQAIGIDYHMEGVTVDHDEYGDLRDAMMLRLDHDVAPGGYAWIFHTGGDTAKVGLCYIQNKRHMEKSRDGMTIDDYLNYWIDTDPRFADADLIEGGEILRGSAHIQMPGSMSTDSFIAIGDTVPTIDPLWGEGIRKCMRSGRAAAVTADYCLSLSPPDTAAETMSLYDDLWSEDVAPNMDTRLMMTELLYMASNERYDTLMEDLRQLDDETLANANSGSLSAILKLLHLSDFGPLTKWLRERYADSSSRWAPGA